MTAVYTVKKEYWLSQTYYRNNCIFCQNWERSKQQTPPIPASQQMKSVLWIVMRNYLMLTYKIN